MNFSFKQSKQNQLQAVILDWAGTTVDFGCMAPTHVFINVFLENKIAIKIEEVRLFMGTHKRDHIKSILLLPRVSELWKSIYKRIPEEKDVTELFNRFLPLQLEALKKQSRLIPGTLDAVKVFKERNLKIGTTTGYTREMMEIVTSSARKQGYVPDYVVCADEVPKGRPSPFMCFENAKYLGVFPMKNVVKIGDTPADIEEGLNASTWTIGLTRSGNEFGLSEKEDADLSDGDRVSRLAKAKNALVAAGAHYVVEDILEATTVLDEINTKLSFGDRP